MRFKIGGNWRSAGVSKHELDALTCALIARENLKGNAMNIGDPEEGLMVLPKGVPGRRQKKQIKMQMAEIKREKKYHF